MKRPTLTYFPPDLLAALGVRGLVVLIAAAAAVSAAFVLYVFSAHEPAYKGKPLGAWLELYDLWFLPGTEDQQKQADLAVLEVGTNGLPLLLHMMNARDSRLGQALADLLHRQTLLHMTVTSSGTYRVRALNAFRALKGNAVSAIPSLGVMLNRGDEDTCRITAYALSAIGLESLGVLTNALTNTNPVVREAAIGGIEHLMQPLYVYQEPPIRPQEALRLHLAGQALVPLLAECLKDPDPSLRGSAAEALGLAFSKDLSPAIIEQLIQQLRDEDAWCRRSAARALGDVQDRVAVPALKAALNDKDREVRDYAARGLHETAYAAPRADPDAMPHYPSQQTRGHGMEEE